MKQTISGLLLMTAVLFSSCPAAGSTVKAEEKTETPVPKKLQPVLPSTGINILIAGERYEFSFKLYAEKMAEVRGIELSLLNLSGNDLFEKVKEELREGNTDLLLIPPLWVPELAETGFIQPLGELLKVLDPSLDDIITPLLEFYCVYDEKLYALPLDGDVRLFYYRKDLVENPDERTNFKKMYGYELSVPQTLERTADFFSFFTRKRGELLSGKPLEHDFFGTGMTLDIGWCHYEWMDRFLACGGIYFDSELRPAISSEYGTKALTDLKRLLEFTSPGSLAWGYKENRDAFLGGKLASLVLWSDLFKFVPDVSRSEVGGKVGVSHVPGTLVDGEVFFRAPMPGGRVLAVSSSTGEPEASFWVASYMSAVAGSELALDPRTSCDPFRYSHTEKAKALSGYLSDLSGIEVSLEDSRRYLDTVRLSIENGVPELNLPFSREYIDVLALYIHRALKGELEPEEALMKTAREWDRISGEAGYEKQKKIWKALYRTWEKQGYAE
jgi:multiple sugar transport system substrate-binding protein